MDERCSVFVSYRRDDATPAADLIKPSFTEKPRARAIWTSDEESRACPRGWR